MTDVAPSRSLDTAPPGIFGTSARMLFCEGYFGCGSLLLGFIASFFTELLCPVYGQAAFSQ